MTDFAAYALPVATELLGAPRPGATKTEVRFGQGRTLNPQTGQFYDHTASEGGGVLWLIERETGRKGKDAVEWLRERGFHVDDAPQHPQPLKQGASSSARAAAATTPHARARAAQGAEKRQVQAEGRRELVNVWTYTDADGATVYETMRFQFRMPDGSWQLGEDGKAKKTYSQRRPALDGEESRDGWVYSLKGIDPVPYRLVELHEAIASELVVFFVEGEKSVDALRERGIPATCNPMGAGKWWDSLTPHFEGAHVVIVPDNDDPGRDHAEKVAAALAGTAASVRVLDLPGVPTKGDVVEWFAAGGSADGLYDLADTASRNAGPVFKSKFGAVPWSHLHEAVEKREWLVKGMITRREMSMLAGPSGSGKSFVAIDLAMAIARGTFWMDRRVMRGGVVYQAGEGMLGLRYARLPAYRIESGVQSTDDIPFVLLTRKIDLYGSDDQTEALIEECRHWASTFTVPLELVVIDTWSAATPGMAENNSEDVSRVIVRCHRIGEALNCAVLLVHHLNAAGEKVRGHGSITADLDSVMICQKSDDLRDEDGRLIRLISMGKVKDGDADVPPIKFVLKSVRIGTDEDGEPETSCVIARANQSTDPVGRTDTPTPTARWLLRAIYDALSEFGQPPPRSLGLPRSVPLAVEYDKVKQVIARQNPDDGADPKTHAEKIKKRLQRAREELTGRRLICIEAPWVWIAGRHAQLDDVPDVPINVPEA